MNIIVKETKKKGKGLFASHRFSRGEKILTVTGEVVKTEVPQSFPKETQNHWFPFDREGKTHYYLLPTEPWMFLNHSCQPNAGIRNKKDIIAMREISEGEEILIDYAMNNIDDWVMECHCESSTCRHIITTIEKVSEEKKKEYKEFILDCLK